MEILHQIWIRGKPGVHAAAWRSRREVGSACRAVARSAKAGPSTVEAREGFRTEPAVAKHGTARTRDQRVLTRGSVGQSGRRQCAPQPRRRPGPRRRLDLDQLVFDGYRRLGRRGSLRGRNSCLGIPHPYLGRRWVHGERCERHDHHQTGPTGHIRRPEARRVPRRQRAAHTHRGHRRGNCHVLFAGLYRNIAQRAGPGRCRLLR